MRSVQLRERLLTAYLTRRWGVEVSYDGFGPLVTCRSDAALDAMVARSVEAARRRGYSPRVDAECGRTTITAPGLLPMRLMVRS